MRQGPGGTAGVEPITFSSSPCRCAAGTATSPSARVPTRTVASAGWNIATCSPTILGTRDRELSWWNIDADGAKPSAKSREAFLAIDYMDLHVLRPAAAIGLHRHRDNQEIFLLMQGKAMMVMGDWEQDPTRERAIEVRPMRPGDLSLVKPGQFHALINLLDEDLLLFMFGGYD